MCKDEAFRRSAYSHIHYIETDSLLLGVSLLFVVNIRIFLLCCRIILLNFLLLLWKSVLSCKIEVSLESVFVVGRKVLLERCPLVSVTWVTLVVGRCVIMLNCVISLNSSNS